ncbi:hypothetical protein [Helicobacter typhlonius]|uniref:hypothetical protein n=1 Tax=Helicobacter typhlonius TaxID=76936 RepID=UPI002FE3A466
MNSINVIYGDTAFKLDTKHFKIPKNRSNPKYRMPFCHQSVFVKTSLLKKYHFDTNFRICADNEFFTKLYNQGCGFYQAPLIVSVYDAYGVSSKPSWQFFKEELRIGTRYNRLYILPLSAKYIIILIKYTIKSLLPHKFSLKIQSIYNAK